MNKERILIIVTVLFTILIAVILTLRYNSISHQLLSNEQSSTKSNVVSIDGKLNINSATQQEISMLPGIGEALSKRIIEYREENGPFEEITDLKEVKGIGTKLFESISQYITVGD